MNLDSFGEWAFVPVDADKHAELLHRWVTHPRSHFWGMTGSDVEGVRAEYARIAADPHHDAWLGTLDGEPVFLTESYHPGYSELAEHYPVEPGDLGMHVLVAPPTREMHGFTSAVMRVVMAFLFAEESVRRVVVEPDIRNEAIAAKNAEVGFEVDRPVRLAGKTARLSFCTREAFFGLALERTPR